MASFLGQLFAEAPSQNSRPPPMSQAEWAASLDMSGAMAAPPAYPRPYIMSQAEWAASLDMSGAMAAPPAYPNAREAALAMLAGSEFREERLAQAQRVEDWEARRGEAAKGGYRKHTRSRKHKGSRKHKNTRKHKGSRKHKRARRA